MNNISNVMTKEFQEVQGIISLHRSKALRAVNNENLLTAWEVGGFVSARLKNSAWGSKTVMQLSEYLKAQDPTLRGYSRRNIYNMVALYEVYSSVQFVEYHDKLKLNEFVQPLAAQIGNTEFVQSQTGQMEQGQIVQLVTAQMEQKQIVQPVTGQMEQRQIVQTASGQIEQRPIVRHRSLEEFTLFLNTKKGAEHNEM